MAIQYEVLEKLELQRGSDKVLGSGPFRRRIEVFMKTTWPTWKEKRDPQSEAAWRMDMLDTLAEAEAALRFNIQYFGNHESKDVPEQEWFRGRLWAEARLAEYIKAEGRPELTEERETGEFDPETGEPIMETVLVQSAIDPLPATIEVPVTDPETGEPTGAMQTVPNPAIVQDEAERAEAQAVLDALPQDVLDFAG